MLGNFGAIEILSTVGNLQCLSEISNFLLRLLTYQPTTPLLLVSTFRQLKIENVCEDERRAKIKSSSLFISSVVLPL